MNIEKIKKIMREKNISATELAQKSKTGQATISEILSSKRKKPNIETVKKISRTLGVTIDEIV